MASITLHGSAINTIGNLPEINSVAPDFSLVSTDLATKSMKDFAGKNLILNIFPSIDTGTCAASVRRFNKEASKLNDTVVLCISKDLPFAQKRFCGAEGIKNVVMLSDYRSDFGEKYGVKIMDSPMKGLLSRAVVVINPEGKIVYEEQVADISQEPNYEAAMNAVKM